MGNVRLPPRCKADITANISKGAKAASKRERKDKDTKVAKSQLKVVRKPLSFASSLTYNNKGHILIIVSVLE